MKILFVLIDILIITLPVVSIILFRRFVYQKMQRKAFKRDFEQFKNKNIYFEAKEESKRLKHIDD